LAGFRRQHGVSTKKSKPVYLNKIYRQDSDASMASLQQKSMDKFKNKYRIPSARLQHWHYGSAGMYFITICTKGREHAFGEIADGVMLLSPLGEKTMEEWLQTPDLRPDMKLELGEFETMPNHFHCVLIIGGNQYNSGGENENSPTNKFAPQSKNIGSVMRGFKSAVTSFAKENNIEFEWQPRFHDHIIRNHEEYVRISDYILNNIASWKDDKFYNDGPL